MRAVITITMDNAAFRDPDAEDDDDPAHEDARAAELGHFEIEEDES